MKTFNSLITALVAIGMTGVLTDFAVAQSLDDPKGTPPVTESTSFPPMNEYVDPSSAFAASDPFVGQIILVPYNFAPRGWAFCEGQLLAVGSYQSLYSVIGTQYGGDGRTTFALPDSRRLEADLQDRNGKRAFRYVIAFTGTYPTRR